MVMMKTTAALFAAAQLLASANAQGTCLSPSGSIKPSVASGYSLQVVATGLARPRGLAFDSQGHLLVIEAGSGDLTSHVIGEENGCVTVTNSTVVVEGLSLNHGIQVNGTTLYASNTESAYSWTYDPSARTANNQEELINGMNGEDHSTRTLQLAQHAPGMIVVSRGSLENLDPNATTIEGGTAQVKAFNLSNRTSVYKWDNDGLLLAWGVRNEVGLAEHPLTGGIWGVENSADQVDRGGVDVSNNNPGEELNFFGYLNGTPSDNQGGYFGYPWCLAVWNVTELPNNGNLSVGDQFAFDQAAALGNQNKTDQFCSTPVKPRQVFQAHMAPLDIKFNNSGDDAWITFHGSWDRQQPVGYHLSLVHFENGEPSQPSNSTTAETVIVSNQDNSVCPENCLRPVAIAFDSQGRIFFSSDGSGEIYLLTRNITSNGTSASSSPSTSSTPARYACGAWPFWFGVSCATALLLLF